MGSPSPSATGWPLAYRGAGSAWSPRACFSFLAPSRPGPPGAADARHIEGDTATAGARRRWPRRRALLARRPSGRVGHAAARRQVTVAVGIAAKPEPERHHGRAE